MAGNPWLFEVIVWGCAHHTRRIWWWFSIPWDKATDHWCFQTWHLPWPPGASYMFLPVISPSHSHMLISAGKNHMSGLIFTKNLDSVVTKFRSLLWKNHGCMQSHPSCSLAPILLESSDIACSFHYSYLYTLFACEGDSLGRFGFTSNAATAAGCWHLNNWPHTPVQGIQAWRRGDNKPWFSHWGLQ